MTVVIKRMINGVNSELKTLSSENKINTFEMVVVLTVSFIAISKQKLPKFSFNKEAHKQCWQIILHDSIIYY